MNNEDQIYQDMMIASTVEILSLLLFCWIGKPNGLIFWIALILLDSFMLKRMHTLEFLQLENMDKVKKQQKQFFILEGLFLAGLVILAFHSLAMAGAMLLNDIVLDVLSLIMAVNEKKNK